MKVLIGLICALFIIFGLGCYAVVQKVQDTPYNCTVLTVDIDGNKSVRAATFSHEQLDAIQEHGGGMLGAHVEDLVENDSGALTSLIRKQEEAFSGAVVCKKSVSI